MFEKGSLVAAYARCMEQCMAVSSMTFDQGMS